jgi:hypothetical protein
MVFIYSSGSTSRAVWLGRVVAGIYSRATFGPLYFHADNTRMTDQREVILARLAVVCAAVTGVASVVRNATDVDKLQRPAVVILDGSEELLEADPYARGVVRSEIQRMQLTPVIEVHARGDATLLSLYRSRLLLAILNDATLINAVTNMQYVGASVAPPAAQGREYIIQVSITFTYTFKLSDLAA